MSAGAIGNESSIAVEVLRKTNEMVKVEGQAANKLLEDAAQVAKNANSHPERGRIIDIHA